LSVAAQPALLLAGQNIAHHSTWSGKFYQGMKNVKAKTIQKNDRRIASADDALRAALSHQPLTPHPGPSVQAYYPKDKSALVEKHNGRIKKALEEHTGAIVKTIGASQPSNRSLSEWVKQVINPFNSPRVTMPYACFTGNIQTCTLGTRFFMQQPAGYAGWMAFSPVYGNNMTCVQYTTSAYASATGNIVTAGGAGVSSAMLSNGPYTQAQLLTAPTPTVASDAVYGRWNACAVRCRNVSPVINEGGSGFMGVTAQGADVVNITDASYVSMVELTHSALDLNTRGEWNIYHLTPEDQADYEFRDEHVPFPRFSDAKVFSTVTSAFTDTQVYPFFIYLSPQAVAQTYEVEISFVVDYLVYGAQFSGASQVQVQPASKIQPHDPFALNVIPAIQAARQAQPDAAHHVGSRSKDLVNQSRTSLKELVDLLRIQFTKSKVLLV